jgi:glycosyltransferase involved in cell wall biosynthesis
MVTSSLAPLVQTGAITIQNAKASRRWRVLIVGHLAGDQLFGAERSLLDIVAAIDPAKYEVLVALPNHNDAYLRRIEKHAKQVTVFPYEWWSASRKEDPATVERFATIIRRDRVDLVHVNTITLLDPLLAAQRVSVPSIVHARELIVNDAVLAAHFGSDAVHTVCSAADYIIANSDATHKRYSQNRKSFRLYNCVEPECFEVASSLESGKLKVGLISSNLPQKGIESFVHLAIVASGRRPELEFFLIGPLNEHASSLREKVRGQSSNIHFVDYLQHPAEALRRIDVLVSLSTFAESFGRTVAEAMAAGRPVIVYRYGALPELVRDGIDGFLIPYGAHLVALERLERLLDDPSLVLEIGRRGRERAKQLFCPGVFAPQLNRIYDQILRRNLIQ